MADLFKSLKPKTHLAKNGFDLSRKHVFSSQAGMALPCLSVETVPGDYFEIDLSSLTRTQTFNTAAFLRGKQRFDFFFVPYTQLWHPFNQFITQRTDKHSTNQRGHIYAPVVKMVDILYHIFYSRQAKALDLMNYEYSDGVVRLLDLLGYGDFRWFIDGIDSDNITEDTLSSFTQPYSELYVNVFRLAAYQHIWYDYYRNKFYDVQESGGIDPTREGVTRFSDYISGFNFDDIDCQSFATSVVNIDSDFDQEGIPATQDASRGCALLKMNYIQWKKDIFTTAMPSQQFGAVSSVDISGSLKSTALINSNGNISVGSSTDPNFPNTVYIPGSLSPSSSLPDRSTWNIPSAFDVLSLRRAEALQAWKQATLRAGNMTDDSFKAHFGVEPYYEGDENVRYLGSFSSALQVNAVETTASSDTGDNRAVGDLAATGTVLTSGSKLKFDVRDYGIIMCISSFLPESEYSSNALDKANTLHEQFDWFTPEFQNIGLEAVTRHEFDFGGQSSAVNAVVGYAPRYYMYKTAVDKVFGEFKDTDSLYGQTDHLSANGTLEAWVAPRKEYSATSRLLRTFYVDPRVFRNAIGINSGASQTTDYFLHNVFFDIKAIRPMSVLGLPQF